MELQENKNIAILLATYNGELFLEAQINSIIEQTYPNWILYIHDDGSNDNTIKIIDTYINKYPNKIFLLENIHKKNGPAKSFMWLLQQVYSDYYMFCDQDDFWMPNKIESTLNAMLIKEKENPQTPIVIHTDLIVTNENLETISSSFWEYTKLIKFIDYKDLYIIYNVVTGCTMMINNLAKKVSYPIHPRYLMHDSWIALAVISNNGVIFPIRKALLKYRQHGNNTIGTKKYNGNIRYRIYNLKQNIIHNYRIYKLVHDYCGITFMDYLRRKLKGYKVLSH